MKTCVVVTMIVLLARVSAAAEMDKEQAITPEQEQFFENEVRPLLAHKCLKCHGAKKQEGGLRLDSLAAAKKGGDSGPAVVSGKLAESVLVEAIEYKSLEMPPDGKLKNPQVAVLKRWIEIGAPWPRSAGGSPRPADDSTFDPARSAIRHAATTHWAFRPVEKPDVPADELVEDRDGDSWARNEIDRFVGKRPRDNKLTPSQRAGRRTLLRRAYLDLIGMPPTPEETKQFLSDNTDQAFVRLVDRLLDDPRYGERWGRHWLDVARYADSKGAIFGEPRDYPFAYTYRDYVIASFNDDKPFDRFLREQLAADQLADSEDDPSLAALGFLTIHRRSNGGAKESQWVDRVDTVTRGMLGMTVACARCHDHKYDPIPTADFYSLLGVFAGIEEPDELPVIGRPQAGSPLEKQYVAFVAEEDKKRAEFIRTNHEKILKRFRGEVGQYLLAVHDSRDLADGKLRVLAGRRKLNPLVTLRWKEYLKTHPRDNVFGAWQACAAIDSSEFGERIVSLTKQIGSNDLPDCKLNPLVVEAFKDRTADLSVRPATGESRTITRLSDVADIYQQLFDAIDAQWNSRPVKFDDPHLEQLRLCLYGDDAPGVMPAGNFKLLDRQAFLRLLKVEADRKLRLALHPGSPRRAMVVRDTQPPYQPYVFLRGNKDRRGPKVPRQFLEVLSGSDRKPFEHGSGRRELADAIASPRNPLTARVIVNRIWLWHFGKGLVSTPSDFGLRADPPSHPQLLDWLAATFVEDGWSIKALHRRIMNSATYQQSSHGDASKFAVDPDNRSLWRYNRRRLDYEAIHDSMLAVSGKLDPTHGGPAVQMIRDAGWQKTASNQTNWQFNPYRRAVYGVVDRDRLPPLLPTFDFASPDETSATRDITTVPTQSLYLMNSPFVMELAAALVARTDVRGLDDPARRIRRIYALAFNRQPTDRELAVGLRFVQTVDLVKPATNASPWTFGYAGYDPKNGAHDLSTIKSFPFHGPAAMQGSEVYPDKQNGFGWLKLTPTGGHASGGRRCLVRRWTSPITGPVTLSGTLKHGAEQGNGVRATIYGPTGRLGQWSAHHGAAATTVRHVEVRKGDTIDFVVDNGGDGGYDGFQWAPAIRDAGEEAGAGKVWASHREFPNPRSTSQPEISGVWQRYAQVLLMSNEFVFVE